MKFKGSLQHLTRFPWWRNTLWWEGEIMRTWMPERYDVIGMGIFNQNTLLFNFSFCRLAVPVISFDWHRSKQAEGADYFPLFRERWSVGIMNMIRQITPVTFESISYVNKEEVTGWKLHALLSCTVWWDILDILDWSSSIFHSSLKRKRWSGILQRIA